MSTNVPTATEAVTDLAHAINRGGRQKDVAEAIRKEHGYLVNQIVYGIAMGVIGKCRFALPSTIGDPITTCGDAMMLLAIGENPERGSSAWSIQQIFRRDHPYHDGELTCNAVRGALVTLGVMTDKSWREPTNWIWA